MMLIMAFLNLKLKASLHAGVAFYISISLFSLSPWTSLIFFMLASGTTWSRSLLGRHDFPELVAGMTVGIFFGLVSLFL